MYLNKISEHKKHRRGITVYEPVSPRRFLLLFIFFFRPYSAADRLRLRILFSKSINGHCLHDLLFIG